MKGIVARRRRLRHGRTGRVALVPVLAAALLSGVLLAEPKGQRAPEQRRFGLCHGGGGGNCVVDGDTFWMNGAKVRIADIDTPETHPPHCAEEARLGEAATDRLRTLLNAGPVTLVSVGRDVDRYGRRLRIIERDGRSLGAVLVAEGLARRWEGRRRPWCDVT